VTDMSGGGNMNVGEGGERNVILNYVSIEIELIDKREMP
jgi:hypothetical protein